MNKLVLLGLRDVALDDNIKAGTDYEVVLTAQRISEEKMDSNDDKEVDGIKYRLRVSHLNSITEVGASQSLVISPGKTPSQKQRWVIINELGEDEYEPFMKWLLLKMNYLFTIYESENNNTNN